MRDNYLEAARVVLHARGEPLSAREILDEARKYGFLASHLHGATMHKTLQARLSEDILEHRFRSAFYRTSPGVFFLRELSNDPDISSKVTREFLATRRRKSLRRQRVLCAPMAIVRNLPASTRDTSQFQRLFESEHASYIVKETANSDPSLAQLTTFCSMIMDGKILVHDIGAYAARNNSHDRSTVLGFKSYVSEFDIDLLNDDSLGLRRNASRELLRYIFLLDDSITDIDIMSRMQVVGTVIHENIVASIITFDAGQFPFELRGRRKPLDLNRPQWLELSRAASLRLDSLSSAALRIIKDDS